MMKRATIRRRRGSSMHLHAVMKKSVPTKALKTRYAPSEEQQDKARRTERQWRSRKSSLWHVLPEAKSRPSAIGHGGSWKWLHHSVHAEEPSRLHASSRKSRISGGRWRPAGLSKTIHGSTASMQTITIIVIGFCRYRYCSGSSHLPKDASGVLKCIYKRTIKRLFPTFLIFYETLLTFLYGCSGLLQHLSGSREGWSIGFR